MFKIINEESKNSKEILKWSKKFVNDVLSDPEIKELSKLPDNEYGEKAIDVWTGKGRNGETVICFNSWGNGGEFSIDGFEKDGTPYFINYGDGSHDSYEDVLEEIKNDLKDSIKTTQEYDMKRQEKLKKAEKEFSKMSQEEKDKIVMDYLINKK